MSIVTLTFDLWPPTLIGCILSSWLTCLPSLTKKYARCRLYRIHKVHARIRRTEPQQRCAGIICRYASQATEKLIAQVWWRSTQRRTNQWSLCEEKCDYRTDRHTHTQTDAGQSDPYVPLCFAGDTIKLKFLLHFVLGGRFQLLYQCINVIQQKVK